MAGMFDYSTTEHVIGTWMDGKPLYRIVLDNLTMPTSGVWKSIYSFDPDVIDNLIIEWSACNTNASVEGWVNMPYGPSTNIGQVTVGMDGYSLQAYAVGKFVSKPCIVICQYTKKTDPAQT